MDETRFPTREPVERDDLAAAPPWEPSPAAIEMLEAMKQALERAKQVGLENFESATRLQTFTIRQAACKTGRSRTEIYALIRKGKIEARLAPGGAPLWLIPAREIQELMPATAGPAAPSGPEKAPSARS